MYQTSELTILVLDDEPDIRRLIATFLSRKFKNVLEAGDSQAALDILKKQQIDVLISDIHLPGGDGIELYHVIKFLTPPVPKVIFVTGDMDFKKQDAIDNGAIDFFYKPFKVGAIIDAVSKINGSILVIADKEEKKLKTTKLLENDGYYVESLCLHDEGLNDRVSAPFDVIYFDLDENADKVWQDVIKEARKNFSVYELPILISCNRDFVDHLAKDERLQINDILPKHFDIEYNLSKLRYIIQSKRRDEFLSQARKQALQAAKSKSLFLAKMSHEIRTPLNALIGIVSLLEKTSLDKEQSEYVAIFKKSSDRLKRILNDILDFSKIESKNVELNLEVLDLKDTMQQAHALFSAAAKEKNLSISFKIGSDLPQYIYSDSLRIQQILSNYLSNAIKFTQKGGIETVISKKTSPVGEKFLLFEIKDTGIGLTKEQMSKLYKSFSQASYSTASLFGGTGLGLSICKQLSSLMGGETGVRSEISKGSVFWFSIKLMDVTRHQLEAYIAKQNDSDKKKLLEEVSFPGKTILIVDDDEINRRVLGTMIKKAKSSADYASTGEEAIEACSKRKYDLIFVDYHLPGINGFETSKAIRGIKDYDTPIIFFTADASKETKEKCFEAGMNDFLTKPTDMAAIYFLLNKFLASKKS